MSEIESADIAPLMRMNRDLRDSAKTLTAEQARYLVDYYYTVQEYRISTANQVRSAEEREEPSALLDWMFDQTRLLEADVRSALDAYSSSHTPGVWAKSITGIGPVIAAGLLAHIKIENCNTAGKLWSFAGYNPDQKWEKGEKRPFNARLKVLCCTPGQRVTTRRGAVPIENVQVGDQVLTHLGRWREVTRTFENDYVGRVHKIVARRHGGVGPVLTDGHPVYVREHAMMALAGSRWKRSGGRNQHMEIGWRGADGIERGRDDVLAPTVPVDERPVSFRLDEYVGAITSGGSVVSEGRWPGVPHPRSKPVAADVVVNADVAWLIGLYLAEGHVSGNHVVWSTNLRSEQPFRDRVAETLATLGFTYSASVNEAGNSAQQNVSSRALAQTFTTMLGTNSYNVRIPAEWLTTLAQDVATALLDGILDGDGTTEPGGARVLTTVSDDLAYGVRILAQRLGYNVATTKSGHVWKIRLTLRPSEWKTVSRVESSFYSGKVYNLEVEEDHSYVVEGVGVHNCWKIGESFVKTQNRDSDVYGHVYAERKVQEVERNEALMFADQAAAILERKKIGKDTDAYAAYSIGKLPPAHIHARAKRYAVKLFLSHYQHVAYEDHFGEPPPKPYIIEHGGHTNFVAPPNWKDGKIV